MSDDLGKFLDIRRLEVDHLVCERIVLKVPQVDAQIVR